MAPALLRARTVAQAALLGVAAAVALTACGGSSKGIVSTVPDSVQTQSTPTSTAAPTRTSVTVDATSAPSPAPSGRVLQGTRQVVIVPLPSFEAILALDEQGRLSLVDEDPDNSLFVFTPVEGQHLIRTAKADASGETSCMRVQANGSKSLTVVAAACDTSDAGQLFTVKVVDPGIKVRPTYAISNRSAYLQVTSRGDLIAEELGDAPLMSTFQLVDNGKATLPTLD